MFIKKDNNKKKLERGQETPIPEINLISRNLKIKLFNKFKENQSKLDLFLT